MMYKLVIPWFSSKLWLWFDCSRFNVIWRSWSAVSAIWPLVHPWFTCLGKVLLFPSPVVLVLIWFAGRICISSVILAVKTTGF